jgi:WD40 repeat protein
MIYSPDCRYLAMVAEETMQMEIREITTGHVIASYKVSDIIKCIAWSSDSRYLAFALKEAVLVREALTGRLVASYTGHKDQVDSIAWHPFDTRIASSSAVDKTIQLWEAIKGSHLATHSIHSIQGGKYIDVGWTPDGTQLIFGSSHATVQVLKRATGQVSTVYRGHDSDVFTVAWSPDGTKIASGSVDKTVQVWHAQTGRCLATHTHSYIANTIAWSPDSQQIASRCVGSQEIHVWNAKTGRHLVTYIARESSGIHAVAWSPNGRFLATLSDENPESIVEIWEVTTKQLVTSYTPIDYERFDNSIAWSPDSMQIASSAASFVIWSPNGRYIASTGPIEVYELFSENTIGYYKPASDDHPAIQVWDTTTDSFHAICQGTALVKSAAWSPDGNYIAAGHTDRVVRIWEIATGRLIATHSGYVSNPEGGITWSPDGNYLAYTAYLDEIQTYPGAS